MRVELGELGIDEGGVLLIKRALRLAAPGQQISVSGSAPDLELHLRTWCRMDGHTLQWRGESQALVTVAATVAARKDAVGRRVAYRTLITLARVARDKDTSADVAALINDRLDKNADMLAKLAGDADDAAWAHSVAHMLHSDAAITAELAKQRPRTPVIPMGMPIGETSWLEDEWMDTP